MRAGRLSSRAGSAAGQGGQGGQGGGAARDDQARAEFIQAANDFGHAAAAATMPPIRRRAKETLRAQDPTALRRLELSDPLVATVLVTLYLMNDLPVSCENLGWPWGKMDGLFFSLSLSLTFLSLSPSSLSLHTSG